MAVIKERQTESAHVKRKLGDGRQGPGEEEGRALDSHFMARFLLRAKHASNKSPDFFRARTLTRRV